MNLAVFLFIPLLSGYIFSALFPPSKYHAAREDGHKLYFRTAFYGIFLFSCSILVDSIILSTNPKWYSTVSEYLAYVSRSTLAPYLQGDDSLMGLAWLNCICLSLSVLLGLLFNLSQKFKLWCLKDAMKNNDIEIIIFNAVLRGMPVSISMKNGKVYVGFIANTPDPKEERKDIRILPMLSGYRQPENKMLTFTTNYYDIYSNRSGFDPEDFEIAFPLFEVLSINLFDIKAYNEFQSGNAQSQLEFNFCTSE